MTQLLSGLSPEPLAGYLAGLGLIRLIGRADPAATFAWSSSGLVVDSSIGDIAGWLVSDYVPTPVVSPWNSGSGFGAKDVEPKNRLARLLADPAPRLAAFREAVSVAEDVVRTARAAGWITADGKIADKSRVVQDFRNRCPETLLPWIDACVVLADDKALFPPLLGTGGNDGRLDFSTNFHQQLLTVFDSSPAGQTRSLASARDLLAGTQQEQLSAAPVGQFDPAGTGGQGSSPFGAAASLVNSWKYVLLVEGALLFAAGVARRCQHTAGRAAMPFTVWDSPDGSDSGAAGEESRGELWVPLWNDRYTLAEVSQLFGEARASWRGHPARRSVDFYAATRALGVARGVSEFVRYGLHQRNGLAFFAVPLDRVQVRENSVVRLAAQVEDWVSWIPRGEASTAVGAALSQFDTAHLLFARDPGVLTLRDLLAALTSLEQAAGRSGRMREKIPVRKPPPARDFLAVLLGEHSSAELRIAVGIASCATGSSRSTARSMRQLLLPVDPGDPADRAHRDGRWRDSPIVPGYDIRPVRQVLADVLAWRSRTAADEAGGGSLRGVPTFRRGIEVPAQDLHLLAVDPGNEGGCPLDERELGTWLHACLALDWWGQRHQWPAPEPVILNPGLALMHALAAGLSASDDQFAPQIGLGPDWAVRLTAGQVHTVHRDAASRVRQAGWKYVVAPPPPASGLRAGELNRQGTAIAAALVPRCREPKATLAHFTTKINTPEQAEELL